MPPTVATHILMRPLQMTEARMPPRTEPPLSHAMRTAPVPLKSFALVLACWAIWMVMRRTVPPMNQK